MTFGRAANTHAVLPWDGTWGMNLTFISKEDHSLHMISELGTYMVIDKANKL